MTRRAPSSSSSTSSPMPSTSTSDSLTLQNVQIDDLLTLGVDAPVDLDEHTSSPATPPAGRVRLYAKADGRLYIKDDTGTERALDAATGGAVLKADFDADTILAADSDDVPQAVTVAAERLIGRKATGGIAALDAGDVLGVLASAISFPLFASQWYDGSFPLGISSTGFDLTLTADRLYAVPFWTPWETAWDEIGIHLAAADAGKKIKLGIYAVGSDGFPAGRAYGGSELSLDSTGLVNNTGIAQTLAPGLWYLALRSNSGSGQVVTQKRGEAGRFVPVSQADDNGGTYVQSDTGTYAADGLPATFPAGPTVLVGANVPRPMLKTGATP